MYLLSDEEHIQRGYVEISFDEASEMAKIAGYDSEGGE